jgi:hypothetical protein
MRLSSKLYGKKWLKISPIVTLSLKASATNRKIEKMSNSIPVSLRNGKSWPTKDKAYTHFKEMLGRYIVGERVTVLEDHLDLEALLTIYDEAVTEGEPTKAGIGIDYFEKDVNDQHLVKTKCFYVVRTDGSRVDFSLKHAINAAARRHKST